MNGFELPGKGALFNTVKDLVSSKMIPEYMVLKLLLPPA